MTKYNIFVDENQVDELLNIYPSGYDFMDTLAYMVKDLSNDKNPIFYDFDKVDSFFTVLFSLENDNPKFNENIIEKFELKIFKLNC